VKEVGNAEGPGSSTEESRRLIQESQEKHRELIEQTKSLQSRLELSRRRLLEVEKALSRLHRKEVRLERTVLETKLSNRRTSHRLPHEAAGDPGVTKPWGEGGPSGG
jgi:predicted nuclease with TOPRIM domain